MGQLAKKIYSPILFDCLFGLAGTLGIVGILIDTGRAYNAIEPVAGDLTRGGALLGVILGGMLLAILAARIDQKCADDYVFQTLTKSAYIAFFTCFFVLALWQAFLASRLGELSSPTIIGILVLAWSLSWFYTRIRGTRA